MNDLNVIVKLATLCLLLSPNPDKRTSEFMCGQAAKMSIVVSIRI